MTEQQIKFCNHVQTSLNVWVCQNPECGHIAKTNGPPGQRPCGVKAPGLLTKAMNFGKAAVAAVADNFTRVTPEQAAERRRICKTGKCGKYDGTNDTCLQCGCPLNYKPELRTWDCPLGFWPKIPSDK